MKRITLILFTFAFALIAMAQHTIKNTPHTNQTNGQAVVSNEWLDEARTFFEDLIKEKNNSKNPSKTLIIRANEAEEILKRHHDGASVQELTERYEILYLKLVNDFLKAPYTKAEKVKATNILSRVKENKDRVDFAYLLDNYDSWLLELADVCWQAEDDNAGSSTAQAWKRKNESRAYTFTKKLESCSYNLREMPMLTDGATKDDWAIPYFEELIDKAKERMLLYRSEQSSPLSFDDILPAEPKRDRRILQFEVSPRNTRATVKVKGPNDADYEPWGEINSDGRVERFLDFGTYNYVVSAKDYKESVGSVALTGEKYMQIVHVDLKRKPISDDTSKKLHKFCEVMHEYGLYVQPTFQVGNTTAVGFAVGGYIYKINIEAGGLFGIGTQEVYWDSSKGDISRSENLHSSAFTLRAGYGIKPIENLRLTPQLGLNLASLKGDISRSHATAVTLGARVEYDFSSHCGISLVPEYGITAKKSDTYNRLTDVGVKDVAGGFNLKIGFNIFF